MNKELDTYPLVDCEPGVKRKMADCRLRLEAARYEAKRVVTRLLSGFLCCRPKPLGSVRTESDVCLKSTLFN